jgi:hypothetical protein
LEITNIHVTGKTMYAKMFEEIPKTSRNFKTFKKINIASFPAQFLHFSGLEDISCGK